MKNSKDNNKLVKIKVLKNNHWHSIKMEFLKKGDIFKIEENNVAKAIALEDPFLNEENIWSINADVLEEISCIG